MHTDSAKRKSDSGGDPVFDWRETRNNVNNYTFSVFKSQILCLRIASGRRATINHPLTSSPSKFQTGFKNIYSVCPVGRYINVESMIVMFVLNIPMPPYSLLSMASLTYLQAEHDPVWYFTHVSWVIFCVTPPLVVAVPLPSQVSEHLGQ